MHFSRYLTTLFLCAAGKRNHKPIKISTPPLHTYCAVAATRHIQMRAPIGKQPNLYAWKKYRPLSYHSSPKNVAPYFNAHKHSKSNFRKPNFRGGGPCLTLLLGCRMWTASAESNEEEESKKRPLDSTTKKKLFKAIENNNIEQVKTFLLRYKDVVNARDAHKRTPFLFAAEKVHLDILKLLKEKGANVNATDNKGNNALHLACMMGSTERLRWLLNNCYMNLEAKEKWYIRTPLLFAAENGHLDILKLLKKNGADVNATEDGYNALHEACMRNHFETVRWLLNNCNFNLEAKDNWNKMTPFLFAAQKGHLDILELLKEKGADVYATDKDGDNALHEACLMGRTETVRWLLDNCDMNLETKGSWERTPFLCAAENGHLDILKALEEAGADVYAKDKDGRNALQLAKRSGNKEVVGYLQSKVVFYLKSILGL